MKVKSIVIIATEFPPGPGGIGKHAFDLARALAWKGYKVTVLTSQDHSSEDEIAQFNRNVLEGIFVQRFLRKGLLTWWHRWSIIKQSLKKTKPEGIIVTGRFSLWMGYLIKKIYGNRYTIHAFVHGSEMNNRNKLFRELTAASIKHIDEIWAVSKHTSELISNQVPGKEIRILPNGLWISDWKHDQTTLKDDSTKGSPSLLTVGRISSRKGQHRVIKALPVVTLKFPEVRYHLVGLDDNAAELKSIATSLHVEHCIQFHGKATTINDLHQFYYNSDIFIMLSQSQPNGDTEGFGIAILEANYFGKPAIGARGSGVEDAIKDGYNGKLVNGDEADEIVEAILEIRSNYNTYVLQSKEWATSHDWKIIIDDFVSSFPKLTNNPENKN